MMGSQSLRRWFIAATHHRTNGAHATKAASDKAGETDCVTILFVSLAGGEEEEERE